MDAGRLQGLAVPVSRSVSWSFCCPNHEQVHCVPSTSWLKSISPGLAIHRHGSGQGKHRGYKITVVRGAIAHDLAAVAVAAATVLPVCWIYVNRSQFSTVAQSAPSTSSSTPQDTTASSPGSGSIIFSSSNGVAEPVTQVTKKQANGAVYKVINGEAAEVVLTKKDFKHRSQASRVRGGFAEDQFLSASIHEGPVVSEISVDESRIKSGDGRPSLSVAPTSTISWLEENVRARGGSSVPSHPADPVYSEFSGLLVNGWSLRGRPRAQDELEINPDGSNVGSSASTPDLTDDALAGERVEAIDGSTAEMSFERSQVLSPLMRTDVPGRADKLESPVYEHSSDSTSLVPEVEVNGKPSILESDVEYKAATEQDRDMKRNFGPNDVLDGSLNARSDSPELATGTSVSSDVVDGIPAEEETIPNADRNRISNGGAGQDVENVDWVQPIPEQDIKRIVDRREELENIYNAISGIHVEDLYGKLNGQRQSVSLLDSQEVSPSKESQLTKLNTMPIKTRKRSLERLPQSLSEILPVNASADPNSYRNLYKRLLRAGRYDFEKPSGWVEPDLFHQSQTPKSCYMLSRVHFACGLVWHHSQCQLVTKPVVFVDLWPWFKQFLIFLAFPVRAYLCRLQDCIVLLEGMDKAKILDTDKIYHSNFFKACQKQKAVREGFGFIRLLSRPTLSAYNMLLCVCRDAQDVDAGLRVLLATEKAGLKPDCMLYTTLISTCAKASKVDIAFKVYHEMETAGVPANIVTYGAMIDGCARAGQIAKAFGVYGIMMSKKLKPDHFIFNSLINACGRAGVVERAFDVLADMKAEPCFLTPNHVTIGALISACARAGQVDRAFEVYKDMKKWVTKGTPECYTAAVHACSSTGDLDLALSVLDDMRRDKVKPDEIFFSALIDVAGQSKKVDAAFAILDEMKKVAMDPGAITYGALMGVCCNTGNWERALDVYKEVRAARCLLSVSTFNALLTALCDAQQIVESFRVLQEMKQAGVQPDQITYSILLDACEKLDEPERAFDLYRTGRAEGIVPNEAMCASVIAICYATIRRKPALSSFPCSIGLMAGQSNEAPYEQWASWAVAVYRHTVAGNVVPTIKSLSQLLGCLRVPELHHEKNKFHDDGIFHTIRPSSILDGAGLYDFRALAIFEEAALMGVIPALKYRAGPITVNAESMPSYVAEVYLVTLLKGLKQRHVDGAQLFPLTIHYLTEQKQTLTATREVKEVTISGRTGQALAALLRRVRLRFQGHESSGKLQVSTSSMRKWLTTPIDSFQQHQELGPLGPPHTFLARGIAEQQRAIRMGQVYKNSADIERVSADSSVVSMYRNQSRTSQVTPWDGGESNDFDSSESVFSIRQRKSRKGTRGNRRS